MSGWHTSRSRRCVPWDEDQCNPRLETGGANFRLSGLRPFECQAVSAWRPSRRIHHLLAPSSSRRGVEKNSRLNKEGSREQLRYQLHTHLPGHPHSQEGSRERRATQSHPAGLRFFQFLNGRSSERQELRYGERAANPKAGVAPSGKFAGKAEVRRLETEGIEKGIERSSRG